MWEKVRGVFPITSNGKNATNFFPYLILYYILYWVVWKVRAAKDLNLINEIKNLNLLRFNFPSKSVRTFRTTQYLIANFICIRFIYIYIFFLSLRICINIIIHILYFFTNINILYFMCKYAYFVHILITNEMEIIRTSTYSISFSLQYSKNF